MKLQERKWSKCKACGQSDKLIQEESFGCDGCGKPIDELLANPDNNHRHYLQLAVFYKDSSSTKHFEFCSWACCLKKLRKIKTDYFISLPYLTYDNTLEKGIRAKDFFALLK